MVFFLTSSGWFRELLARVARDAVGRMICVISDYSMKVIAMARSVRAIVVADRPGPTMEQELHDAEASGEIESLFIVDITGNGVPQYKTAPKRPRRVILTNGTHSSSEAVAFDLHVRGHSFEQIGHLMHVDSETARTFVRRAESKNKRHPEVDVILQRLALSPMKAEPPRSV